MKNKEILELYNFINSNRIKEITGYGKFQFVVVRNLKLLKDEVDSINSIIEEYNEKVAKCYKEHCIKDEKGEVKSFDGLIKIDPIKEDIFKNEIKSINEQYSKQIEDYNSMLEEEYKGDLRKIKLADIEGIELNTREFYIIDIMIEE